jgi:subtilisin family serine protease
MTQEPPRDNMGRGASDNPDLPFGQQSTVTASPEQLERWGMPTRADEPGAYIVELNLLHRGPVTQAQERFLRLWNEVVGNKDRQRPSPVKISQTYYSCLISRVEQRELIKRDKDRDPKECAIFRIWPDFEISSRIDRSVATVKADAARRAYAASGRGITWAVLDSGIDETHEHFAQFNNVCDDDVKDLHRDFTVPDDADRGPVLGKALVDDYGHGTHVAGIIAGGLAALKPNAKPANAAPFCIEKVLDSNGDGQTVTSYETRDVADRTQLSGVAPACRLVSLKVLGPDGKGRASNVMRALHYIREYVNADPKILRIQGVNISAGYEFNAEVFACGQSPLCVEVDRLVRAGVVVVVASGNTGYGQIMAQGRPGARAGLTDTINDPGNAERAITVGATHRHMPHTYGVSYFSSKGPTADGRMKPDLVAPGERITSCATGSFLSQVSTLVQGANVPKRRAYIDYSGTSMAAPHVSGAIAAFLSIRQEFIQRPDDVKRIFLDSATSLGRERYFEGHGLVDLMRAIQSV